MGKCAVFLLILVAAITQNVYSKSLPSFLKPCKRTDPKFNDCVKTILGEILKRSGKGEPKLNIPSLEPFVIPKIELDQGASKAVTLKATLNNISVTGITTARIEWVKADMEKEPKFEVKVKTPALRLQSNYEVDGKILVVPMKGSGKSDMNLTDIEEVVKINTKFVEKKGGIHLEVASQDVDVSVKNGKFYFENLFNGNKELGEQTNTFINENWQELYKELKPVISNAVGGAVAYVVKIVLAGYTYDEIFPPK